MPKNEMTKFEHVLFETKKRNNDIWAGIVLFEQVCVHYGKVFYYIHARGGKSFDNCSIKTRYCSHSDVGNRSALVHATIFLASS